MTEHPTRNIRVAPDGWVYDAQTSEYVMLEGYDANDKLSIEENYLRAWLPEKPAEPEQQASGRPPFKGAADLGSGWYVDQHPTHFDWREDVAELIWRIEREFYTFANTYYDHPPTHGRDATSVDFWHPNGRGVAIDTGVGYAIRDYIMNDPNPPLVDWYIWQGMMWMPHTGEQVYPDLDPGSDAQHLYHLHVTFQER